MPKISDNPGISCSKNSDCNRSKIECNVQNPEIKLSAKLSRPTSAENEEESINLGGSVPNMSICTMESSQVFPGKILNSFSFGVLQSTAKKLAIFRWARVKKKRHFVHFASFASFSSFAFTKTTLFHGIKK